MMTSFRQTWQCTFLCKHFKFCTAANVSLSSFFNFSWLSHFYTWKWKFTVANKWISVSAWIMTQSNSFSVTCHNKIFLFGSNITMPHLFPTRSLKMRKRNGWKLNGWLDGYIKTWILSVWSHWALLLHPGRPMLACPWANSENVTEMLEMCISNAKKCHKQLLHWVAKHVAQRKYI